MSMVGSIISNASNNAERQRNGDADLSSFLVILNRNLWKISATPLLSLMLAGIYLAIAKPMYTASASLYCEGLVCLGRRDC